MTVGVAPQSYSDIYPAIEPDKFTDSFTNKVAFVTGAGRGIGKAIALAFARAGANVALLARTKSELDDVAEEIKLKHGTRTLSFSVDVTDSEKLTAAFEETERVLGKVNILVANAAMAVWRPFIYSDFDAEVWKTMEINVKAPLLLMQLAANSMRERGEGTIIAISSIAGIRRLFGLTAYCVSKSALNCAIGNLQLELDAEGKSGIHTFSVNPGTVSTKLLGGYADNTSDMDKLKPGATKEWADFIDGSTVSPDLCAQTCVYLATGQAGEIRGRCIDVQDDIESIVKQADLIKEANLYDLGIRQLGI